MEVPPQKVSGFASFRAWIASPLRVYILLGTLALTGIWAGTQLPVSLFPNVSKPMVGINVSYPSITSEEFANTYGNYLEYLVSSIATNELKIDRLEATYDRSSVRYQVEFAWGNSSREAAREVSNVVQAYSARMPTEIRDSVSTWSWNRSTGFFAASFFSEQRSLEELFGILEPILKPELAKISDAQEREIFNPQAKEIRVQLKPEALAQFQIWPREIEQSIRSGLEAFGAGSVTLPQSVLPADSARPLQTLEDFDHVVVTNQQGKSVYLSELASIDYVTRSDFYQLFKTGGAPSLILWVSPKADGNVKRMSEDIRALLERSKNLWPKDIRYEILVDPSEFISGAVQHTFNEILLGSCLAVLILFLFIGSLRNTLTTAIEIPISMCLAFILMKMTGMNLNLISLGGLALASGMNVDASVVVLENILRHLEKDRSTDRLSVIVRAVKEVSFSVIAATIASIVVFLPLAYTSALANAVLGDLARAVIFSHGFSALVALILVPTVRWHLMRNEKAHVSFRSPIEPALLALERSYGRALHWFLNRPRVQFSAFAGLIAILASLILWVLPTLPREMIGEPDTDWVVLNVRPQGATRIQQTEALVEDAEQKILSELGDSLKSTFTRIHGVNTAFLNLRLKHKREMGAIRTRLEKLFPNTPQAQFDVSTWNPSELPIPKPPQLKVGARGGKIADRLEAIRKAKDILDQEEVFPRIWAQPDLGRMDRLQISTSKEQWAILQKSRVNVSRSDLFDLARVASEGKRMGWFPLEGKNPDIVLRFPEKYIEREEDLGSLPIGVGAKILPLRAFLNMERVQAHPFPLRENQQEAFFIFGRGSSGQESMAKERRETAAKLLSQVPRTPGLTLEIEDGEKDLNDALFQLQIAIGVSVFLIFLTMVLQFGSLASAFLILLAVPLGLIGVITSLAVFGSSLSLNSALGVILLNGISVANSILLVDFIRRGVAEGKSPTMAAIEAGQSRLRPILITSLTTILAMVPIALGLGEGGRILQPLGISVAGGLWVSTTLTLFVVPSLQVMWLKRARKPLSTLAKGVLTGIGLLVSVPLASHAAVDPFLTSVESIVRRDPTVASKRESLEKVEWSALGRRAVFMPTLTLSSGRAWGTFAAFSYGVSSDINLFRFGADLFLWQSAGLNIDAERASLESTLIEQEQFAVELIVQWIERIRERDITHTILELQRKSLDISRARFRKGLVPIQEVEKLEVDVGRSEILLMDLEIALVRAKTDLEQGLGPEFVVEKLSKEWIFDAIRTARDSLLSAPLVVDRVPSYLQADLTSEAQRLELSRTERLLLPSVGLSAALTQTQYVPASALDGSSWSVGINVSWPIFDQLVNYTTFRSQVHTVGQAEQALERTRRTVQANWQKSKERFRVSMDSLEAREKNLRLSRKLYEDGVRRFQAGRVSANELFVEHRRWLDGELLHLRAMGEIHRSVSDFCHSIGKTLRSCLSRVDKSVLDEYR